MTAKTLKGKVIYSGEKHYHPQATTCRNNKMIYGAQWKTQYIRDTSLQPYQTKSDTFEIFLPKGVKTVDLTVTLAYEINKPANKINIHTVKRRLSLNAPQL